MNSLWFWTQAYIIARQRLIFVPCMYLNFGISSPLNPNSGPRNMTSSVSGDESFIMKRPLPRRLHGPLPTSPFLSTSEGDVSCEPAWYSEQSSLWRTLCTPWRPFFICNPEDLNFLTDSSFYLFSLLWTAVITTSTQGLRKVVFRFFPLYLFTAISTFCLTKHFFFIRLTHSFFHCFSLSLPPSSHSLLQVSPPLPISFSLFSFFASRVFTLWLTALTYIKITLLIAEGTRLLQKSRWVKSLLFSFPGKTANRRPTSYQHPPVFCHTKDKVKHNYLFSFWWIYGCLWEYRGQAPKLSSATILNNLVGSCFFFYLPSFNQYCNVFCK